MQKFCIAIFLRNSLQNQQQKMNHVEILHFNFDTYKIRMQKFCRAIFPPNSLKNQQQMDNAEILHFNFDTYKLSMQKFCRAIFPLNSLKNQQQIGNEEILHFINSGCKNSAKLHFAKFIIKTTSLNLPQNARKG